VTSVNSACRRCRHAVPRSSGRWYWVREKEGNGLKFLFLEPFFGGSHQDFAEGLISHSQHRIDLITLPSRFWKWRMRGAALYFLKKVPDLKEYNGLITSDLMSLSDFKGLTGPSCPPALTYFHENQLTYPLAPGGNHRLPVRFYRYYHRSCLTADPV